MSEAREHPAETPRILLLSGGTGAGHFMAARALEEELRAQGVPVTHVDAYTFISPAARWAYTQLHLGLMEFVPELYGPVYERGSRSRLLVRFQERLAVRSRRAFAAVLARLRPESIVVTHALGVLLAAPLKAECPFRLVVLTTDYRAHAFHVHPNVDWYCVSHAWAAADLEAAGVAPERITVTGIPLRPQFDRVPDQGTARAALGLPPDRPVLLVTRGGMAAGSETVALLRALLAAEDLAHCQIVAILGQRSRGYRLVSKVFRGAPRLRIERFVPEMVRYLAAADLVIGKAGGLASTETFAVGSPLVLYAPNEGIETANVTRFVAAGAVRNAERSPERAVEIVRELLASPARRAALTAAGRALVGAESRQALCAALVRRAVPVPAASASAGSPR